MGTKGSSVHLVTFAPSGDPAIAQQVDEAGAAMLTVGHPDRGTTVTVTPYGVDLWSMGNLVARLGSDGADQGE